MSDPQGFEWIASDAALAAVVDGLRTVEAVAVDTEFRRRDTFFPQIALVQLAYRDQCWLIDPLALQDARPLAALLTDSSVIKVLHSASEDLEVFEHWLGVLPRPLFDTQKAAAMLNHGFGLSYRALVERELGIALDKEETQSDWLARPLSASQLAYAAQDVIYLAEMYPAIAQRVSRLGRFDWVLEEGDMASTGGRGPLAKFKSAWKLSSKQQAALVALIDWREAQARARNKPRSWVLADKTLTAIAQRLPESSRALGAIEGVHKGILRRSGDAIVNLVNNPPPDAQQVAATAFVRPPSAVIKSVAKRLQPALEALADELEINAEIMMPARELELLARIAAEGPVDVPQHWSGWRARAVIAPLQQRAQALLEEHHEAG